MNEMEWKSYICVHTGRYTKICYPDGEISESFFNRIQSQVTAPDNGRSNQILTYIDGYAVIACYAFQIIDGVKTSYSHAVIFPQSLELQQDYGSLLYSFPFISWDEARTIAEMEKKGPGKGQAWLKEYVQSQLEKEQESGSSEDNPYKDLYNKDTWIKAVCQCLYEAETNGSGVRICVPENVEYSEYCRQIIQSVFSCIPYGLRNGISFATNPSETNRDFKIIFGKFQDGEGISLEVPWEKTGGEEIDEDTKNLLNRLIEDKAEDGLKGFYNRLEKPYEGSNLVLRDYVDCSYLDTALKKGVPTGTFLKKIADILNRDNAEGVKQYFENRVQAILQEQKMGTFCQSKLEKIFQNAIQSENVKDYGGLLEQLKRCRKIIEKIVELEGWDGLGGEIFSKEYGIQCLETVWKRGRKSDPIEALTEDIKLLEELKRYSEELEWYFGGAVEAYRNGLPEIEEKRFAIEQLRGFSCFIKDLEKNQDDHELCKLFEVAKKLEGNLGKYLTKGEEWGDQEEEFLDKTRKYVESNYLHFIRKELESGIVGQENRVRKLLDIWMRHKKVIRQLIFKEQSEAETWYNWVEEMKQRQEEGLKEKCWQLKDIYDFYSYLVFAEESGWEESIMELLRDLPLSKGWRGGRGISSFVNGAIRAAEEGKPGQQYYEELSFLINEKRIRLYLHINRGNDVLRKQLLEELRIWRQHCAGSDELSCICEGECRDELILLKEDILEMDIRVWDNLGDIETEHRTEQQLIWERMVPMGYYPLAEWWEKYGNSIQIEPESEVDDPIRKMMVSWVISGPGVPWHIKEQICLRLREDKLLWKDERKQIQGSDWLSDLEKKTLCWKSKGKVIDNDLEMENNGALSEWELGLRLLEKRVEAKNKKRIFIELVVVAIAVILAGLSIWQNRGEKTVREEIKPENDIQMVMETEPAETGKVWECLKRGVSRMMWSADSVSIGTELAKLSAEGVLIKATTPSSVLSKEMMEPLMISLRRKTSVKKIGDDAAKYEKDQHNLREREEEALPPRRRT